MDPEEMKSYEWILPETTANFQQLPLQYRGVCGYTLVEKNGLLLPGSQSDFSFSAFILDMKYANMRDRK